MISNINSQNIIKYKLLKIAKKMLKKYNIAEISLNFCGKNA